MGSRENHLCQCWMARAALPIQEHGPCLSGVKMGCGTPTIQLDHRRLALFALTDRPRAVHRPQHRIQMRTTAQRSHQLCGRPRRRA
jgi:hypothetical protein